jgi:hypothetical protein
VSGRIITKWYIYHAVGGKLVMDVADHTDHHRQALAAMGLPPPKFIVGTPEPMPDDLVEHYAKSYGLTVDKTPRKPLPEFVEPASWTRIREEQAARKAAKGEAKNDGNRLAAS